MALTTSESESQSKKHCRRGILARTTIWRDSRESDFHPREIPAASGGRCLAFSTRHASRSCPFFSAASSAVSCNLFFREVHGAEKNSISAGRRLFGFRRRVAALRAAGHFRCGAWRGWRGSSWRWLCSRWPRCGSSWRGPRDGGGWWRGGWMRRSARRSSSISRSSASFWRSASSTSSRISSSWSIVCLSDSAISVACATAWLMAEVSAGRKSAGLTQGFGRGGSGRRCSGRAGRSGRRSRSGFRRERGISAGGSARFASTGGLRIFFLVRGFGAVLRRCSSGCGSRKSPEVSASASRHARRERRFHRSFPAPGSGRNFFGGTAGGFGDGGTRAAAAATAAAAAAAAAGAARGGGQIQIGLFVRHKLSREDGGFARKCNGELRLLFHKQRQRGGVAVQEILFADRADLAVAEKTGQPGQVKMRLHQRGVVAGPAKQIFAAAVAAKQAAAVDRPAGQVFLRAARAVRSCPRPRPRRRGAETGWSGPCAAARRRPARRNSGRRRAGCAPENRRDETHPDIRSRPGR